jgi:hypothetical protein
MCFKRFSFENVANATTVTLPDGRKLFGASQPRPAPRASRVLDVALTARVNNLLGRLPLPRPVAQKLRQVGNRVRSLPIDHRLVHSSPVEVGAD